MKMAGPPGGSTFDAVTVYRARTRFCCPVTLSLGSSVPRDPGPSGVAASLEGESPSQKPALSFVTRFFMEGECGPVVAYPWTPYGASVTLCHFERGI